MRIRKEDVLDVFTVSNVVPAIDFGVGVVGFLTNRFGIGWDVRRFQSVGNPTIDVALTTTPDGRERLLLLAGADARGDSGWCRRQAVMERTTCATAD